MKLNLANLPRIMMWTAAGIAAVGLLTILVVQTLTVVLVTRPPMVTRWFTGIFVICQQGILASIAMGIAGYALHETRGARPAPRLVASHVVSSPPALNPAEPAPAPEKLPSDLRAAVAQLSGKRR